MADSNYAENRILDLILGGTALTPPATFYAQLHSSSPTDTGTGGATIAIPRVAIPNNPTNFPAASGGSKTNGLKWNWGSTAGQTTLLDATHVSLWDALTGGNMWKWGALDSPLPTADREEVNILPGGATFTHD